MLIGNSTECHMMIVHATVSRHHCSIFRGESSYMIRDLDSTNGTYVNDRRVKRAVLTPGDRVGLGRVSLVVSLE